ncbi:MAG: bifunctional UDP-N-acetylglucosamine diphosphorylase/glucosamine-1-phosphate N-acetyltransferase GlmU [Pseudomonadota bacterium]
MTSSTSPTAIILAAGEGTRMRSPLPKVLHPVGHKPLIAHVMDAAKAAGLARTCLVLGHGRREVEETMKAAGHTFAVAEQTQRLGTGHAVMTVRDAGLLGDGPVMVLLGDAPLIRPDLIEQALARLQGGADIAVVGFEAVDPTGYGRLIMDGESLRAIVEEKDAAVDQRAVTLCNSGLMAFAPGVLAPLLGRLNNDNAKGEYYLTDAIGLAAEAGQSVAVTLADEADLAGVNTRADLAAVEAAFQSRRRHELMLSGVSMQAPETVMLAHDTVIEPDVTLEPNIVFGLGVTVRSGATIRAFCHLEGATVGEGATIGPFARLRPETTIGDGARVGNFCEVKKAAIDEGAKVNHLSYIGDAHVGAGANIGAGTITCNYDGRNKHHTEIGEGAFIGSNSALVAPVTVEAGGYVGSGSVITKTVPSGDLAIARAKQVNLRGRAPKPKNKRQ